MHKTARPRIVVQERGSLLYAQGDGQWIAELAQALEFVDLRSAHDFALRTERPDLEIIMSFGEDRANDVRIHPREKPA